MNLTQITQAILNKLPEETELSLDELRQILFCNPSLEEQSFNVALLELEETGHICRILTPNGPMYRRADDLN